MKGRSVARCREPVNVICCYITILTFLNEKAQFHPIKKLLDTISVILNLN